jgi:uncharacterized phage-associated protein
MTDVIANAVADFFILRGPKPNGEALTQLSLYKMMYIAEGWHLAVTDAPLIEESFLAFQLGPVPEFQRRRFAGRGRSPITADVAVTNPETMLSAATLDLLDRIHKVYGRLSSRRLVDLTHTVGSPWHRVWTRMKKEEDSDDVIPRDWTSEWFKAQLNQILAPGPGSGVVGVYQEWQEAAVA